jgi:hypothetical protein
VRHDAKDDKSCTHVSLESLIVSVQMFLSLTLAPPLVVHSGARAILWRTRGHIMGSHVFRRRNEVSRP